MWHGGDIYHFMNVSGDIIIIYYIYDNRRIGNCRIYKRQLPHTAIIKQFIIPF